MLTNLWYVLLRPIENSANHIQDRNTFAIHTDHYHLHENDCCCCQSRSDYYAYRSTYFKHKYRFFIRVIDFGKRWRVQRISYHNFILWGTHADIASVHLSGRQQYYG